MTPERYTYRACGLSLVSDAAIPGLHQVPARADADVTVSLRGSSPARVWAGGSPWYVSPGLDSSGRPEVVIEANDEGFRVAYCDDTTVVIDRRGRHVSVTWSQAASADAASYLTSYVLAFVVRLRGSVPLHASAVAIDGRAVLFVGDSWAGKSSTAAAFSVLGYPVLSDDIVRVDAAARRLVAYPSHPQLHVWHDSADALYAAGPRPAAGAPLSKRCLEMVEAFQSDPLPIGEVFVLGERSPDHAVPSIRSLSSREALMTLVGHAYGGAVLDRDMRAREFDVLSRLVDEVPVRELKFADDLGALVSSCQVLAAAGPSRPAQYLR